MAGVSAAVAFGSTADGEPLIANLAVGVAAFGAITLKQVQDALAASQAEAKLAVETAAALEAVEVTRCQFARYRSAHLKSLVNQMASCVMARVSDRSEHHGTLKSVSTNAAAELNGKQRLRGVFYPNSGASEWHASHFPGYKSQPRPLVVGGNSTEAKRVRDVIESEPLILGDLDGEGSREWASLARDRDASSLLATAVRCSNDEVNLVLGLLMVERLEGHLDDDDLEEASIISTLLATGLTSALIAEGMEPTSQ